MPDDNKTQVLQATDIVELIRQSVALKRAGRNFQGLCPFHMENTPSFSVNPARQYFYCFGCKEHGNAIDFVMKRDRVEFRDALEILARAAGIELVRTPQGAKKAGEQNSLYEANEAACKLFENQMSETSEGAAARKYMLGRGFTAETLGRFHVGVAVDGWDALLRSPLMRKFPPALLFQAGLVKARENGQGHYDTFRNRIMFPIRDPNGRVIAFGGRVMPGSTDPAKYLNSPETPIFTKGRSIFGLDVARQRIVETRTVAVVEGYTDVAVAHQFGAANVVSVLGTAMTEQHVSLLRRFADRIVLLFDADSAGEAAAGRALQLFLTQPIELAVATMPAGLDPDEFLLKNGLAGFETMMAEAPDALSHAWRQLERRFNSTPSLTGQQHAVESFLALLEQASAGGRVDSIRWGQALLRVSRLTGMPVEALHRRFQGKGSSSGGGPAGGRPAIGTRRSAGRNERISYSPPVGVPKIARKPLTSVERAQRHVLGALLAEPSRWEGVQIKIGVLDFADPRCAALAAAIWQHQRDEGDLVFNEFLNELDASQGALAVELAEETDQLEDLDRTVSEALGHLADLRRARQEQDNLAQLSRQGAALDERQQDELLRQASQIASRPDPRRIGPRTGS